MRITEFKIEVNILNNNDNNTEFVGYDDDGNPIIYQDLSGKKSLNEIDLAEIEEIYEDYNYDINDIKEQYPQYESIAEDIYNCNNLSDFIDWLEENVNEDNVSKSDFEFISGELNCEMEDYNLIMEKYFNLASIKSLFDDVRGFRYWQSDIFNAIMEYYGTRNIELNDLEGRIADCDDGNFTLIENLEDYACEDMHNCYNYTVDYDYYIDYEQYAKDNWDITETNYGWLLCY